MGKLKKKNCYNGSHKLLIVFIYFTTTLKGKKNLDNVQQVSGELAEIIFAGRIFMIDEIQCNYYFCVSTQRREN